VRFTLVVVAVDPMSIVCCVAGSCSRSGVVPIIVWVRLGGPSGWVVWMRGGFFCVTENNIVCLRREIHNVGGYESPAFTREDKIENPQDWRLKCYELGSVLYPASWPIIFASPSKSYR